MTRTYPLPNRVAPILRNRRAMRTGPPTVMAATRQVGAGRMSGRSGSSAKANFPQQSGECGKGQDRQVAEGPVLPMVQPLAHGRKNRDADTKRIFSPRTWRVAKPRRQ